MIRSMTASVALGAGLVLVLLASPPLQRILFPVPMPVVRVDLSTVVQPLPSLLGKTAVELQDPAVYRSWIEQLLDHPPDGLAAAPEVARELAARLMPLGGGQISMDDQLSRTALAHALDQLGRNYDGSVNPEGRLAGDRVAVLDRTFIGRVDELTGHVDVDPGTPTPQVVEKLAKPWMGAPVRALMADPKIRINMMGLGVARQGDRYAAVLLLARAGARLNTPVPDMVTKTAPPDLRPYPASTPVDLMSTQKGYPVPLAAADPGTYRLRLRLSDDAILFGPEVSVAR